MSPEEERVLIVRCKQNVPSAFSPLVAAHQERIFRLAFRLLADEEDAKDAVQESFIKAWVNIRRFDGRSAFSSWIYKIAANICYDRIRAGKRMGEYRPERLTVAMEADIAECSPEGEMFHQELCALIRRFTGELSPKQKMVFVLREIEGLELDEIRAVTGLTNGKIKSNLYLAKKWIKEKLNSYEQ